MQITVRPLADADLEQVGALLAARDEHAYGASEPLTTDQHRVTFTGNEYWDLRQWVAEVENIEGGTSIAGLLGTMVPLRENLDSVMILLDVHPALRGHGAATALVEQALRPALAEIDRELVTAFGMIPIDGEPDDPTLPVNRVAARLGVSRKNISVCSILDLPLENEQLEALAAGARHEEAGYRIETFVGAVPAERIEQYGALLRQIDLDDPDEDVESEVPDYSPERIRVSEARRERAGKRNLVAIAVAPDGTLAGNSEIQFLATPGTTLGWQENTLVMPEHRGHGLGMALKLATHRQISQEAPDLRRLVTWNSHVNPWMLGINRTLGYRPAFREVVFQGRDVLR